MPVTVKVKQSAGAPFEVSVEPSMSVLQLKRAIEVQRQLPVEQQRLIYKGQVLEDDRPLEHYDVAEGHTIHLVRGQTPSAPPHAPPPLPSLPAVPAFGGLVPPAAFGRPTMDLFNVPAMSSVFGNPDVMRELMLANPTTRQIMERNPEVAQALQDPRTLRQAMEMMRNPSLMQEMTRNTDRALSNLDVVPGGMDALSRLYHEVQRPLEEAREESLAPISSTGDAAPGPRQPPLGPLNPQPLPNPWQRHRGPGVGGGLERLMGPSYTGGGLDYDAMSELYRSPLVRQMAMQMMQNPETMQQALRQGGGLGSQPAPAVPGVEAAEGRGLGFSNLLLSMMQRSSSTPPAAGMSAASDPSAPPPPSSDEEGSIPVLSGPSAMGPFDAFLASLLPAAAAGAPVAPPQQTYAAQLQQLREMGFDDEPAMLQALQAAGGNVMLALERLLGTRL